MGQNKSSFEIVSLDEAIDVMVLEYDINGVTLGLKQHAASMG
jgi:hypothetical protein